MFSGKEIAVAMGYSPTSKDIIKSINMLLDSFHREGVIDIKREYLTHVVFTTGEVVQKPVIYLDNVMEKYFK